MFTYLRKLFRNSGNFSSTVLVINTIYIYKILLSTNVVTENCIATSYFYAISCERKSDIWYLSISTLTNAQ